MSPDQLLAAQFPGVVCWYGLATRKWWALTPTGKPWCPWLLVEGVSPDDLTWYVINARR